VRKIFPTVRLISWNTSTFECARTKKIMLVPAWEIEKEGPENPFKE